MEVVFALTIVGMSLTPVYALIRNVVVGLADYALQSKKLFAVQNVLSYQLFKARADKKVRNPLRETFKELGFMVRYERKPLVKGRIKELSDLYVQNLMVQDAAIAKERGESIVSFLYKPKTFKK